MRSIEREETRTDSSSSVDGEMNDRIAVLVADDNMEVLMAIADLMEETAGIDIVSLATNVNEAVQAAESHRPHVAFIDAWLRGGGAEAAARGISSVSPDTVVVALASANEPELHDRLRAVGVAGCYEKETLSAVLPRILAWVDLR